MTPTVALFRAREDSEASAARLESIGWRVAFAPVLAPVALATPMPPGPFDRVLATSAKAVRFAPFPPPAPAIVVGARTAAAAQARGWALAGDPAPDVATLARRLAALPGRRALYIAGRDRKPCLEQALARIGVSVVVAEVYAAEARDAWTAEETAAVAAAGAALHYSRRSSELALALAARAEAAYAFARLRHIAISADAAEPLRAAGLSVVEAAQPNEDALFAALAM